MITVCSAQECSARIRWVLTETGKRMPIDADPAPDGNLYFPQDEPGLFPVDEAPAEPTVRAVTVARPAPAGVPLYLSHFVTCPAADDFRRRT